MIKKYITAFVEAAKQSLNQMFGDFFEQQGEIKYSQKLKIDEGLIIKVPFTGSVNGAYLLSLGYDSAHMFLDKFVEEDICPQEMMISLLSEMLNTVVGEAFSCLLEDHPNLTFLTPFIFHSPATFPKSDTASAVLVSDNGSQVNIHFRLDTVVIQVQKELEATVAQLTIDKEKAESSSAKLLAANKKLQEEQKRSALLLKKAEHASKVKAQFLAVMSHEMRTPLNAVIGFTDILLDECLTGEQREMLGTVKRSSNSLLAIINDVLDITKIEADSMELECIAFNLEDVIFDSAEMARAKMRGDGVEINVDIGDLSPHVLGDSTKIRQVLTNLAGNAVKFTDNGEILLKIETIHEDEHVVKLKFSVIDTGIGMSDEQQKYVFEPFKQADSSTTRKYGGTGLGLSISKGLVELLGGKLQVESKEGQGSIFTFQLTFSKADKIKSKMPTKSFYGKRALIIDDNDNASRIMKTQLEFMGVIAERFKSYDEFMKLSREKYDIAFLDIMMPSYDGFEVLEKLMENGTAKEFVGITALMSSGVTSRIHESKFKTYVSKPIRPSYIEAVMKKVFTQTIPQENHGHVWDFDGVVLDILVAEDNLVNQKLIVKVLRKMGHEVDLAENGRLACEMVQAKKYDIVFMDMLMPEMGGVEATEKIRSHRDCKELPIIAMTANATENYRNECLNAGMDDFIAKPIKREKIWQAFNNYCYEKPLPTFIEQPRVLIIEDDQVQLQMLTFLFQTKLPAVSWKSAMDGVEACTLIGCFRPHLILSDVMLPNMDGIEVIQYLQKHEIYENTRVFVITSLDEASEKMTQLKTLDVDAIFQKPLKNEQLFHAVRKNLYECMNKDSEENSGRL